MKLLNFHKIGENKANPRLFLESARLSLLGFKPGTSVYLSHGARRLTLSTRIMANAVSTYTVSRKRAAGGIRPVLDINNRFSLSPLSDFSEAKIIGTSGMLTVSPSVRAFHIRRALAAEPPFRVLELFAGGGTLSKAFDLSPYFDVVAGMELEPRFADCWQESHPHATLIQSDIRLVSPLELPQFDILAAGIPCTDHSSLGRARKGLSGCPETGKTGDLFIHVLAIVAARMPVACLFENVPNFGESLAGKTLKNNMKQLGYSIEEQIIEPNAEWGEPSNRRRWVAICCLRVGFQLVSPKSAFSGTSSMFLDEPNPIQDRADAERIAVSIAGLREHNARHHAKGNGFRFTILNGNENNIPVIVKSMHKINSGPFVATPFGLRMLRKAEVERIQGSFLPIEHYATAIEIYGQGVQTRLFSKIIEQLGNFLVMHNHLSLGHLSSGGRSVL